MARKVERFIGTEGRDKGKVFIITEMSAYKAEKWAFRALLALAHAGAEVSPEDAKTGMAGIAASGIKALQKLEYGEAQPLLDEMLECVKVQPDPKGNKDFTRDLVLGMDEGDDIEELMTLIELRERIFKLHTDFFLSAKNLNRP